jgi:hypothetical protein
MIAGFRVKSGYAIAVLVDGTRSRPDAVARAVVDLCDPTVPETKQPHHDGFGVEMDDRREIARRTKIIERCAATSIEAFIRRTTDAAARPLTHGVLVVGSVIDPETVGNPHIRAHAYEGQLFRTVLAGALQANGVACDVVVDKTLPRSAAIAKLMTDFGRTLGRPWRTDEKAAATAAWMLLPAAAHEHP